MIEPKQDLITWPMLLSRLPALARLVPRLIKARGFTKARNRGLIGLFEQARQRHPEGTALLFENRRYSYGQLDQWADRLARTLQADGVGQGDVVAVWLDNRPELLVTVLAVAKLGAVSALAGVEPFQPSLDSLAPSAVVVGEEWLHSPAHAGEQHAVGARRYFVADRDTWHNPGQAPSGYRNLMQIDGEAPAAPLRRLDGVAADGPCLLLYSGATSDSPAFVAVSHERLFKTAIKMGVVTLDLRGADIVYCPLPLQQVSALCLGWGAALAAGAGLALRRQFSASQFWADVRRFKATTLVYAGELCRYLVEQPPSADDIDHPLRKMLGSGLRPDLWAVFRARFGLAHIAECYGASDGAVGLGNVLDFDNTFGFSRANWALVEYVGPLRGPDGFMRRVTRGREGLLLTRLEGPAPLDPGRVLCDVFEAGDRYLNTGDLLRDIGYGHGQFVDRLSDTFCWQGEMVSSRAVENTLLRHPQIAEAVVYGVTLGQLDGQVGMAAITPAESLATLDFSELLQFAQRWLPAGAIPRFLRIKLKMEISSTFTYHKARLREEAFDPRRAGEDPLFAWLPGSHTYVRVTERVAQDINDAKFVY